MASHDYLHFLHPVATTLEGVRSRASRTEASDELGTNAPVTAPRWLLVLLTAIGPTSFQIFLPSLPSIRDTFGVSAGTAQLALSLSMLGIAVSALGYGSLADRFGRRPVLIAGMGLLLAGSLTCAAATSIEMLIVGRIIQATGGASGMVVTRAIVLDVYGQKRSGQVLAGLLAAMMIAPMLATPLGGLLNDTLGWRTNFLTVALAGAATLGFVFFRLPETLRRKHEGKEPRRSGDLIAGYRQLFASRCFNGFAFEGAFAMAAFVTFTTAAPYALSGVLGLSATQTGLSFVVVSIGFAGGSLIAARLPATLSLPRRAIVGSVVGLAAACAGMLLAISGVWTVAALIGPAAAFGLATGITMPASQAGAIGAVPALAGTASGLSGFLGTFVAAGATQVMGLLSDGTPLPVMIGMSVLAAASLAATLLAFRREQSRR